MCGFIVTNKKIDDIDYVNYYLRFRGPDNTNIVTIDNWTFVHNLLSIAGSLTLQPIIENDIAVIFNGEIYNYNQDNKSYQSDVYFILDQYKTYGEKFVRQLDGEFALVVVDFSTNKLIFSGDLFLTKPIYFAQEHSEIGIASYQSCLTRLGFTNPVRLTPNKYYVLDLTTFTIQHYENYAWNLEQHIDSYEVWVEAFFNSLDKRTNETRGKFLVPMSSGHDSGSIVCGLTQLKKPLDYIVFSYTGNEDVNVVHQRISSHDQKILKSNITNSYKQQITQKMNDITEPFFFGPTPLTKTHDGFSDVGCIGLFSLLEEVKNTHGIRVQFSGQGGDEIMSTIQTYGFRTANPSSWPDDLTSVFPWGNFYYGANWSYLNKEECVAGSLGIETRYPLLDKQVVQAFLNLTSQLKNKHYKAPIHYLFTKYDFPFIDRKLGFNLQIT